MDHQHIGFTQLQNSSTPSQSFDQGNSHYVVFTNANWPPIYQHQASVEQSQISPNRSVQQHHPYYHHPHHHQSSSLDSLDFSQPSSHCPLSQPLQSPDFALAPPTIPSNVQATPVNVQTSMRLNTQMRGALPLMDFGVSGSMASSQLGSSNRQIGTSVASLQTSMPANVATAQQALQNSTLMYFPTHALATQYSGNFDSVHSPQIEDLMSSTRANIQPNLCFVNHSTMNPMNTFAGSTSALDFQDCSVVPNTFSDLYGDMTSGTYSDPQLITSLSSPDQPPMTSRSLSNHSDLSQSWQLIDVLHDSHTAYSPVHCRSDSSSSRQSDHSPGSAASEGSFEEIMFNFTPEPEVASDHSQTGSIPISDRRHYPFASYDSDHAGHSPLTRSPRSGFVVTPIESQSAAHSPVGAASLLSISALTGTSPKSGRRTSPPGITPKVIVKKKITSSTPVRERSEKKVGRRRGPLNTQQREQAHETRKVGACLRCRFLKKVCNPGNPCGGCQPSHARLWQVPCTRLDIKDIGYFIKDWDADYKRHLTNDITILNFIRIDGPKRLLYVTHGYGYSIPIWTQTVHVRNESCFGVDWSEQRESQKMQNFEIQTARLCVGGDGITKKMVSDYVDLHLDSGFDHFVNAYFDGTPFLSELLKSINRHYLITGQENLRKGLRFVIAYALTLHITLIEGLSEEEAEIGKIKDASSRYIGNICAPVMINFVVKKAMGDLWRELMTEVLTELSALYASGFSGQKVKIWPTAFMMASLLLTVWEMMQFDCHYRVSDADVASRFCETMEEVPVGVIVGLFAALSTKLPGFHEWDTRQHGNFFGNNQVVCNTMTEVRQNIEKHEKYLRSRSEARFCRDDFDSLSNKFLSKLVIRA